MKFKDKKVLVFGSGISGVSAAALLLQEGAEVVLYDGNDRLDAAGIKEQIEGQAKGERKRCSRSISRGASFRAFSGCDESGCSDRFTIGESDAGCRDSDLG